MTEAKADVFTEPKKLEAPDWFRSETMFRADLDLGDIVEGASAVILSARGRFAKIIEQNAPKKGDGWSWDCRAAILSAHVESVEGVEVGPSEPMDAAPPKRGAGVKDWARWMDGADENIVARLFDGCIFFRADIKTDPKDTGETGNA